MGNTHIRILKPQLSSPSLVPDAISSFSSNKHVEQRENEKWKSKYLKYSYLISKLYFELI